jgi:MtN3 and saliva related transmembrane protein
MCDDKNMTIDTIGISGGLLLSMCLIPQIIKVIQTREVENISYTWQFMYIIGLSLHLTYALYYMLLPIYIPTSIELSFIILLTILKCVNTKKKKTENKKLTYLRTSEV